MCGATVKKWKQRYVIPSKGSPKLWIRNQSLAEHTPEGHIVSLYQRGQGSHDAPGLTFTEFYNGHCFSSNAKHLLV